MQYSAKKVLLFSSRQITLDASEVVSYVMGFDAFSKGPDSDENIYSLDYPPFPKETCGETLHWVFTWYHYLNG